MAGAKNKILVVMEAIYFFYVDIVVTQLSVSFIENMLCVCVCVNK